jgi:hypothetical protein
MSSVAGQLASKEEECGNAISKNSIQSDISKNEVRHTVPADSSGDQTLVTYLTRVAFPNEVPTLTLTLTLTL